ncbi:hypothetical protein ACFQVC_24295 [Streptomyces monticola]|uniref:HEAT repeat domain-containing protein n=1 Tax=Streptomyces monticola TaxID=2666263 RepID=A0ABW2JN76_9ACTN
MSLVELIAQADERDLAASGLACLDRCLPLLGGRDEEVLRPLWASLEQGADWGACLARARAAYPIADTDDEATDLVLRMLGAAPETPSAEGVRAWADACSVAALQVHRLLDTAHAPGGDGPLAAGELRRQVRILELLAATHDTSAGGLRRAFEVSTEGRRVLRAAVSRRARGRV